MSIHKKTLFRQLNKRKKADILALLELAFDNMPESMRSLVFDAAYQDILLEEWDAARLLAEIRQFRIDSLNGKYYAPFGMDSKNYGHIPEETQIWFDQLGRFIEICGKAVERSPSNELLTCFEETLGLITLMEDNTEIVFAHEYGSWMIPVRRGYLSIYAKAWAQVGSPEQFAEKIVPWLVWDSHQGFADKLHETILSYASSAQIIAIQQRIDAERIVTKK